MFSLKECCGIQASVKANVNSRISRHLAELKVRDLSKWEIHLGVQGVSAIRGESELADVANDADYLDLMPGSLLYSDVVIKDVDVLSNRILTRELTLRKGFAKKNSQRRTRGIAGVEKPAAEKCNSHRFHIPGGHGIPERRIPALPGFVDRTRFEIHPVLAKLIAAQGQLARQAGCHDPRNAPHRFHRLHEESVLGRLHLHRNPLRGVKAKRRAKESLKTPQ